MQLEDALGVLLSCCDTFRTWDVACEAFALVRQMTPKEIRQHSRRLNTSRENLQAVVEACAGVEVARAELARLGLSETGDNFVQLELEVMRSERGRKAWRTSVLLGCICAVRSVRPWRALLMHKYRDEFLNFGKTSKLHIFREDDESDDGRFVERIVDTLKNLSAPPKSLPSYFLGSIVGASGFLAYISTRGPDRLLSVAVFGFVALSCFYWAKAAEHGGARFSRMLAMLIVVEVAVIIGMSIRPGLQEMAGMLYLIIPLLALGMVLGGWVAAVLGVRARRWKVPDDDA